MKINTEKYRDLLKMRREEIRKELKDFVREDPFQNPDHASDNAHDTDAFEQIEHEKVEALEDALKKELSQIEQALKRIEKGTYGICESCGKQISTDRLDLVPASSLCIDCKENS